MISKSEMNYETSSESPFSGSEIPDAGPQDELGFGIESKTDEELEEIERKFLETEDSDDNEQNFVGFSTVNPSTNSVIEKDAVEMEKKMSTYKNKSYLLVNPLKVLVSKKKKRFNQEGFSLDLVYILPNIIAMGYPSTGAQKYYRNNLSDVKKLLDKKHKDHYKVYNLCAEEDRNYPPELFDGNCARYGFYDHNPPDFFNIFNCIKDIHEFLTKDSQNVVAIHCKAGKGRTGVIISCYLLFMYLFRFPELC